jgi:hypothetical protein
MVKAKAYKSGKSASTPSPLKSCVKNLQDMQHFSRSAILCMENTLKGGIYMAQEVQVIVKNIFKNADMDTSVKDLTQKWIELINQMEKNKNILPPPPTR